MDNPRLAAEEVLITLETRRTLLKLRNAITLSLDYFTLFLTDTGYLGGAALGTKDKDQIALLAGCDYPMIVRSADSGYLKLIAPAFVAGVMNGEAWPQNKKDLKDIILI
jgi:hypothetical protein